ncbi:MAG TPA: hypothetical protein VF774_13005 [Pseudoduganella sp.]|jgi:hypothetical protein
MKTAMIFPLCCALMAGCATTPPEALEQAHHTSVLIGALNDSLDQFSAQQRRLAVMAAASIATQDASVAEVRQGTLLAAATSAASGDAEYARVADGLRSVATAVAQRAADDGGAAHAARLRAALTVPDGREAAMAEAQRASVAMSGELEPAVRWKEQRDFLETVGKGVKANRDRIDKARAAADSVAKGGSESTTGTGTEQ